MTLTDRIADLSMLWKQASVVFPYFDRLAIDWDRCYRDFLERVLSAGDERKFHLLIAEFMNQLRDGHTDYAFPKPLIEKTGSLPFALKYLPEGYYIREITAGGEEHLAARVLSINGAPMKDVLAEAFCYGYHVGDYMYPSKLHQLLPFLLKQRENELETSAGTFAFDLLPSTPRMIGWRDPEAPAAFRSISPGRLDIRLYEGDILCVRLDDFLHPGASDEIAEALDKNPGGRGVILDLRENVGGMTAYGAKVAELFISGRFHGCCKWTRTMTGIDLSSASQVAHMSEAQIERCIAEGLSDREEMERCRKINKNAYYREYLDSFGGPEHQAKYTGPCVLLTSRNTISAAEDFTAMFRSSKRAVIIGTPTHGSTGTPLLQRLSCGGRARICSVGYRLLDGTEFIGCGIRPDIAVELGESDFLKGTDPILAAALEHLTA